MLIGAHESIAGGFEKSIARALEDECEAVQIFTGPPGRWTIPQVEDKAAQLFRRSVADTGAIPVIVHGVYLINPAGPDADMWVRSLMALKEEYARCRALGVSSLVIHPGSHRQTSVADGIKRAAEMIQVVLDENSQGPDILLENTAGSGSSIGNSFIQLAAIREMSGYPDRVHFCFDTAHAYAAGYDLRDQKKVKESLNRINEEGGLENVRCVHLNDSMKELGSRVDRHERIGKGYIGENGFRAILKEEVFSEIPGILETQPLPDSAGRYLSQVRLLKKLAGRQS